MYFYTNKDWYKIFYNLKKKFKFQFLAVLNGKYAQITNIVYINTSTRL